MELTVSQALKKGIAAHKAGMVQEADRYYTAVLKAQPRHPEANHNLGILAVGIGKLQEALPFLKIALEVNPDKEQFWTSYIDVLTKLNRLEEATGVIAKAKSKGISGANFHKVSLKLAEANTSKSSDGNVGKSQMKLLGSLKLDQAIKLAKNKVKNGATKEAEQIYREILKKFPKNKKAINGIKVLTKNSFVKKSKMQKLDQVQRQMLINFHEKGQFKLLLTSATNFLLEFPSSSELYNFIGAANKGLGELESSIIAYNKAVALKPDYADAYYNRGIALEQKGQLKEAINSYKKAIENRADYPKAFWNLSGTAEQINEAKNWIEKCLLVDPEYEQAKLTLCALDYYLGDKSGFKSLMNSSYKEHPYVRSFAWVFDLPTLPELYFHRWALFDRIVEISKKDRPFYEFGVWRGESFKYLIKTLKTGYGFDTFEGLPEAWHNESAGTYSSDGNIPKIKGGEFIVGKFEDTLPRFFEEPRPKASIINLDADLYSSTICALNYAASVIDQHTILIFDEFLINENWELDEYRALNEFCKKNKYEYEVIAVSFFSKQVAVRIQGI